MAAFASHEEFELALQDVLTITAPEEVTMDKVLKGIFGGQDGATKPRSRETDAAKR